MSFAPLVVALALTGCADGPETVSAPAAAPEALPDRFTEVVPPEQQVKAEDAAPEPEAAQVPASPAESAEGGRALREEGKVGRDLAGDAGLSQSLSSDLGDEVAGLIGAKGAQVGSGGLGSRGAGQGAGGTAAGLGGLGTKGHGSASSGYGSGGGSFGAKGEGRMATKKASPKVVTGIGYGYGSASSGSSGSAASTTAVYGGSIAPPADSRALRESDGEGYAHYGVNEMTLSSKDALSTFSIDVDTASYTIARRKLLDGYLPPEAAVRVEEFVNYFPYSYVQPTGDAPFAVNMEAAPNPFEPGHHVLRVGVQGRDLADEDRKPVRLTFLVDVSGSMSSQDKLGLAKRSLHFLVDQLGPEDSVALGTYAGATQMILDPTSANDKDAIHAAIENLRSGGGTAMSSGIDMAYDMAKRSYVRGAENRVVVMSDGDANIGPSSHQQILTQIQDHAKEGISLTTVGFGMGNYQDTMMEQLANDGDGNYFYIDDYSEAKKVFGQDLSGTLQTIARDVKIQVEFDPEAVYAYRLIGYENRDIADRDFRNDAVDAGEVGSGHKVTALYDVVMNDGYEGGDLATVRLRNKPPGPDAPAEEWLTRFAPELMHAEFEEASWSLRLAFGAASFAELLRDSPYAAELTYEEVRTVVSRAARGKEALELVELIEVASGLVGERSGVAVR